MRGVAAMLSALLLAVALSFPSLALAADGAEDGGGSPAVVVKDYTADLDELKALVAALAPSDALPDLPDYTSDIEDVKRLLVGLASVNLFILLACLLSLGVSLASVFVASMRRVG